MDSVINVGVFPCGSEVGLEIYRSLKYYRHFNIIGLNSVDDNGRITFKNYIGDVPFITSDRFIPYLKEVIKEQDLKFLIPAMDEVGYLLKENEEELGCEIVYPNIEIGSILRKKSLMYITLSGVIKVPKVYSNKKEIAQNLPVFVKPDVGYGSRGAYKISVEDEIPDDLKSDNIYSEYLPGVEYTIDCFSDSMNNLLFVGPRKRERVRMGISVGTGQVDNSRPFKVIAEKINKAMGLKGVWFFQLKENKTGELCLLEIGGRVSGSMALYRGVGVNFIALELFRRLNNKVEILSNNFTDIKLERSFDCHLVNVPFFNKIYCDFDDCLIISDNVNTSLLAFLYQCLNDNKEIILITRHLGNPIETLRKFKIDTNIFTSIIHIENENTKKYEYIDKDDKPIFIDDSFRERDEVKKHLGIPTFSPDAVDLIISKKF